MKEKILELIRQLEQQAAAVRELEWPAIECREMLADWAESVADYLKRITEDE